MIEREWEYFWWNNITGPQKLVRSVAEMLLSRTTVILQVPSDLPWRHQMRGAVENQLRNMSGAGDTIIYVVDAVDDCPQNIDVGRYLLQRFATGNIQNGYREKSGITIQDYIIQNAVLKDSIVWVKGLDSTQGLTWIKFCKDYNVRDLIDGVFVLEIRGAIPAQDGKRVQLISFEENVCEYDVQLFNSFILDEQQNYSEAWKRYISTLAAHLCGTDAEISELYLKNTNFMTSDPLSSMAKIAEMPEYVRRGADVASDHILSLLRKDDDYMLKKRVWFAQIQILYPIIEIEKIEIIRLLYDKICFYLKEETITQFGHTVSDPFDIEIGTLGSMASRKDTYGNYRLYIPNEADRMRLYFLRDCRNLLAHGNCCNVSQVKCLLRK